VTRGKDDDPAFAPTEAAATDPGNAPTLRSSALEPGEVVGERFLVQERLGEGTFGWVFSAQDLEHPSERAALKVLRPEHSADGALVARFKRRELELLQRVHANGHRPNVVRSLSSELVDHHGLLILLLELIDGASLDEIIRQERMLDQGEARRIAAGIARGLQAIHAADGVHRDLKPANIRVRGNGEPVILDLGIARAMWETQTLTATGEDIMTPMYASPEQLSGREVTSATDVYALGLILYEMLTGTVPLAGRTRGETMNARVTRSAPDPRSNGRSLDDRIAECCVGCLARDPQKRPSAAEVVQALETPIRRRSRRGVLLGAAAGGAVVSASLVALLATRRAPTSPSAAIPAPVAVKPPIVAAAPPPPAPEKTAPKAELRVQVWPNRVASGGEISVDVDAPHAVWVVLLSINPTDSTSQLLYPGAGESLPQDPSIFHHFPTRPKRDHYRVQLPKGAEKTREAVVAFGCDRRETCTQWIAQYHQMATLLGPAGALLGEAEYEIVSHRGGKR
jgi:serine/threonine-protein kinase